MLRLASFALASLAFLTPIPAAAPHPSSQHVVPCDHSLAHVCEPLPRKTSRLPSLERRLTAAYWSSLPSPVGRTQFIDTSRNALQAAEDSVYELAQVTRDAQRAELETAKSTAIGILRAPGNRSLFPGIEGEAVLDRLATRIESVELRYGREWVESAAATANAASPGTDRQGHRAEAWMGYHETCGREGLTPDMFMGVMEAETGSAASPGSEVEGLVPCPGFVLELADHAIDESDILPALQFTFGIQLGLIIIEETADLWTPDQQMAACFGDDFVVDRNALTAAGVTLDRKPLADLLAAHCWGAVTLGRRLAEIDSLSQRTRITALALHPTCRNFTGAPPAMRRWLISQIGQVPSLAAQLPNAGPATDRPYCAG